MKKFTIEINEDFKEIEITTSRPLDYNLLHEIKPELDKTFEENDSIADYKIEFHIEQK